MLLLVNYGQQIGLLLLMENNNVVNPFVTGEDDETIGKEGHGICCYRCCHEWKM